MSQWAKETIAMPDDIYESMLKVFIKLALETKHRNACMKRNIS